jgi:butyryl-CoA dehydrogenase
MHYHSVSNEKRAFINNVRSVIVKIENNCFLLDLYVNIIYKEAGMLVLVIDQDLQWRAHMKFEHTEEQSLLREMVRDFAETEIGPSARERDEEERFDRDLMFGRLAELGLTGVVFPEEYGGAGADYISYAIAVEELSRVCGSTGVTLSAHLSLGANPIYLFGTEEQKQKFLVPLATGEKMGAFGLTEPSAGSDAGGTRTTAVRDGDNWILNGSKIFITNAGEAETYVVFARTDKDAKKHHGISAFIIEKDTPGFSFGKKEKKLGIRSSPTMEILFDNCPLPGMNLLGKEGEGFKVAMKTLDGGRIGIASQALGLAQGALDVAVAYARERKQFDTPIARFQGIQFQLADMATQIEASRFLVYNAAYRASEGLSYSKQSAMAKLMASETAMRVTTQAVQVLGGYGYTREFPVERMMRDAKITEIYEGTSEIQRIVIGSALTK